LVKQKRTFDISEFDITSVDGIFELYYLDWWSDICLNKKLKRIAKQ